MTYNEYYEKVALMLSQSRTAANKSQEEMADLLGVCTRTIQNWEAGISAPDAPHLIKWFNVLRMDMTLYYSKAMDADGEAISFLIARAIDNYPSDYKKKLFYYVVQCDFTKIIDFLEYGTEVFKNEDIKA